MEADARARRGLSPAEARRTALRDFGGVAAVREAVHDTRGMSGWDALSQDVRFALRTLRRWPGFTAGTVLTLALGIGANTAIFSIVNDVLLEPLPYADGHELVRIDQSRVRPASSPVGVSIKELSDYRQSVQALEGLVEYHGMSFVLLNQGEPDRVETGVVSSNFFDAFGVRPVLGRGFEDKDDDLGSPAVLLLGHAYWQKRFGGDPNVVGRVVQMNDKPHTVVGVLPAIPQYPRENDVYMPTSACPFRAAQEPLAEQNRRAFGALRVFGRLKDGVSIDRARAEVSGIARRFANDNPEVYDPVESQFAATVIGLNDEMVSEAKPILLGLLATAALVLLIACANVANLSLSRMSRRDREMAVRIALGAGRGRLVRQLLTESSILALFGGTIGLGLAWASLDLLTAFASRFTPRVITPSISLEVLLFTFVVSVLTGLAFGILPALAARPSLTSALKEGGAQAGDGVRARRMRSALVVAQVAVCFALLVGAGLFIDSLRRLSAVDLGYRADQVLTAEVFTNWSRQTSPDEIRTFYTNVLERLRSTPGVTVAAITNAVPLSNISPGERPIIIEGRAAADPRQRPLADLRVASDGYFEALMVSAARGRLFSGADNQDAPPVAIINQTMASLWGGGEALGGRFRVLDSDPWLTVIGVVPDLRQYGVERESPAQYYTPFLQSPGIAARVLLRTQGNPMDYVPALKAAVAAAHPEVPVEGIETLESLRAGRLASPALNAALLAIFAALALVITLAGIAAVIGTSVSQRTREFGLRMALGATRASLLNMVLGQGMALVGIGLIAGAAGAVVLGRGLGSYLYQTKPSDPLVYVLVAAVFLTAAAAACLAPARRATSIDPLKALRAE
jgi:predicted permease